MADNQRKEMLRRLIGYYNSEKSKHPREAAVIDERIREKENELRLIEEAEARQGPRGKSFFERVAARPVEEDLGRAAAGVSEGAARAGDAAAEAARRAREAYKKSVLNRDVGEMIGDTKSYKRMRWKAKEASELAKSKGRAVDEWSEAYFPTFRKGIGGGAKLAGKGIKGAALGAKAVGGAAIGAGIGLGNQLVTIGLKGAMQTISVGFWLVLTFALQVVDFLWLRFGGIDYNAFLTLIQSGGIPLLIKIIVPIYVLAGLVIFLALKAVEARKTGFFVLMIFIPLSISNYLEINYSLQKIPYIGLSLTITTLIASMIVISLKLENRYSYYSWVLLFLTGSTIVSLGGLYGGFHHLIVAFLIWIFVIKQTGEDWARANYLISVFLIIDFFGYGILRLFVPNALIANRFVFPLWFLFIVFYTAEAEQKKSMFSKIVMAAVIIVYIIALVDGVYGWVNVRAQMQAHPEELAQATSFWEDALSKIKNFPKRIVEEYQQGMTEATGGYYQGKVEENQDPRNELGVHIDNLEAADMEFYQNEEVVVWGDLKARTLDEPVYIYMKCNASDVTGTIKPDGLTTGYKVSKLEEIPFECRFRKNTLKVGTNEIKVMAEFNFKTYGYLKTYFMDIERLRALRRENVDPLGQYGIDKKPQAVYTNGPVKLGIGTVDPPLGLSREPNSAGYSYVGVTVEPQWFGKIKKINNVEIQIPKELSLEKSGDLYCRDSFENVVGENEEGYAVYNTTDDEIERIKTPIDTYKSWRCSINIPSGEVPDILGNTPVATYYYRANADYVYEIEKSISVYVKEVDNEKRTLFGCDIQCDDKDGCVCDVDECGIPKGGNISASYTCNNDPSPSNTLRGYTRTISDIDGAIVFIDAYLTLNDLCAQGSTEQAKTQLENLQLNQSTKDSLRGLLDKCSNPDDKLSYIEPGERAIVEKVEYAVQLFSNAKANIKLTDENKVTLNQKKGEFITKIGEVISKFKVIKDGGLQIQDQQYIDRLNSAINNLNPITY